MENDAKCKIPKIHRATPKIPCTITLIENAFVGAQIRDVSANIGTVIERAFWVSIDNDIADSIVILAINDLMSLFGGCFENTRNMHLPRVILAGHTVCVAVSLLS